MRTYYPRQRDVPNQQILRKKPSKGSTMQKENKNRKDKCGQPRRMYKVKEARGSYLEFLIKKNVDPS
jgi:hypothetical protein